MNPKDLLISAAKGAHESYASWVAKGLAGPSEPVRVFAYDLPVRISGDNPFLLARCWVDYGARVSNSKVRLISFTLCLNLLNSR